jgi:hypothetical protein
VSNLPVNPLTALVARAQTTLPRVTGATQEAEKRRATPRTLLVLADVSASMAEMANGRRKIDALSDALQTVSVPILLFSSYVTRHDPRQPLPAPAGGTALHLALDEARGLRATGVLVISDGHPDDPRAALAVADRMTGVRIDIVYCGPDIDSHGLLFMRRLARFGGAVHRHSLPTRQAVTALIGQ